MMLSKFTDSDKNNFRDYFLSLGFNEEQINIILSNPNIKIYDDKIIMYNTVVNFKYLLEKLYKNNKGYEPEKIHRLLTYNYKLLITSKNTLEENWQKLLDISITDSHVSSVRNDSNNFLHFSNEDAVKMVENKPEVICTDTNNIISRINKLKEFGYTKEQIMHMAPIEPSILVKEYEEIKNRISLLANLKYNKNEIIHITSKLPLLFHYSYDALEDRFFLIEILNLHNDVIERPDILKQSPKLTYARYMYFLDNNISIEVNSRKIFLQEKLFSKFYHITKEELLEKYDYQNFQDEKAKIFVNKEKKY